MYFSTERAEIPVRNIAYDNETLRLNSKLVRFGRKYIMTAQNTFEQLSEFWRSAYSTLNTETEDVESTLINWIPRVLTDDGLSLNSPIRKLFSFKPPEPFFGNWMTDDGKFLVEGKTVVALINPGDGITYSQCADPDISLVGRAHWQLLKEFYTTGAIRHNGKLHRLLYTRKLRNSAYNYRAGTRHFAWGWWSSQWENMLRAIGETDEDDSFLTLELFAYSSLNANDLNSNTVDALLSSRLTVRLIVDLIQDESARPKRIVLVNKRSIWEPLLQQHGFKLIPLKPRNSRGNPKAYHVYFNRQPTQVPVIRANALKM
jgi:hypothetical protein